MEIVKSLPSNPVGFWRRVGASLLDALIVGIPLALITYVFIDNESKGDAFSDLISFLYSLLVPVFWDGYTVGKRVVGIRIVKMDGSRVGIGVMLLRVLVGGLVYVVTLGIGLVISAIMVGAREDKRSIHDLIAGTYVTANRP